MMTPHRNAVALVAALLLVTILGCESTPRSGASRQGAITSYSDPYPTFGEIERLDPALDLLIPPGTELQMLAEGFDWSEGPVWVADGGYLLFSDIPPNSIYKWKEGSGISLFMRPSGYNGTRTDIPEPGSNGLRLDRYGRLVLAEHGNRRIARLESLSNPSGLKRTLVDRYQGKRFNSPNDLTITPSGDIYFTDPPYGLKGQVDDPEKELDFQGVYLLRQGSGTLFRLTLLAKQTRPNGIAMSPDGKTLYVANSDPNLPVWYAYDVLANGTVANQRVLFDASHLIAMGRSGLPDGMKVDMGGNLWATGPGGVLIISPEGKHLGTILTGQATANCTFGEDGSTLFVTADMYLGRIDTNARGLPGQ